MFRKALTIMWVDGVVIFLHLVNRYLLGAFCVPGMGLGARNGVIRPSGKILFIKE